MAIYALIDAAGLIVNRVVVEDDAEYEAPDDLSAVRENEDAFAIGGSWIDDVYTPPVPTEEPIVRTAPSAASKLGLIRALREAGSWPAIKAAIAANDTMQEDWDAAQEIRRTDPLTQAMIAQLGLNDAQVDALLTRAAELVA